MIHEPVEYSGVHPNDIEGIQSSIEEIERSGGKAYSVIIHAPRQSLMGGTEITVYGEPASTLDDIAEHLSRNALAHSSEFCRNANEYGGLYDEARNEIPVSKPMYEYWSEDVEPETAKYVYLVDSATVPDKEDDDEWDYFPKIAVHEAPLEVSIPNLLEYGKSAVFGYSHIDHIDIIPARTMLAEYQEWVEKL